MTTATKKNYSETTKINLATSNAARVISDATSKATDAIAEAAMAASKLLISNAADVAKITGALGSSDHDAITTLIGSVANLAERLTEKFNELKSDIKDLSDGTTAEIADHETRLKKLEDSEAVLRGKASQSLVFIGWAFTAISLAVAIISLITR